MKRFAIYMLLAIAMAACNKHNNPEPPPQEQPQEKPQPPQSEVDDAQWQMIEIKHCGEHIAAPRIMGGEELSGHIEWGNDDVSEINTVRYYTYDDATTTHTITIKATNATTLQLSSCEGVSEIDLSQF